MKFKKRKNGTGSAVYLGNGRYNPWAARILIGKDKDGRPIYYDIDTFETELEAIVCLENYHKNPIPLKIKKAKYDKIVFPPQNPYPLVPVDNLLSVIKKKDKKNYTFKQVFEEMKENLFPTKEEIKLEKEKHIKPSGKFAYHNASNMITAFHNSKDLYDKIYRELKTSDWQNFINNSNKTESTIKQLIKLFRNMDKYAYNEDIIDKKYADGIKNTGTKTTKASRTPFTYEQINYLWNIENSNEYEMFVRDFLLLAIYTGCRAEELFFLYTRNIHLKEGYLVGGLKTENGINREIPIHDSIKPIIQKYYNKNNEFLFMKKKGNRIYYPDYSNYFRKFEKKHPFIKGKTAHCGRHTLETELQKLNIRPTIINSIIGHKNGDVGSDIYNHVSLEEKIEAINLVNYSEKSKLYIINSNKKTS